MEMTKQTKLITIDCTRELPPDQFFSTGDTTVVDGPAGRYREAAAPSCAPRSQIKVPLKTKVLSIPALSRKFFRLKKGGCGRILFLQVLVFAMPIPLHAQNAPAAVPTPPQNPLVELGPVEPGQYSEVAPFVMPTPQSFSVPTPAPATLYIDAKDSIEPVNRRVMGIGLMYPPFDPACTELFKGALDGTSGRAWAHITTDEAWSGFMPFVKDVGIRELLCFDSKIGFEERAKYISEEENNLFPHQQPKAVAEIVRQLNKTPHPGFPDGYGVTGWEIWNEPGFPRAGNWPPDDLARYTMDISKAIRSVDPTMDIGAPLYEQGDDWRIRNARLLKQIAAKDIASIDFVVSHPYAVNWQLSLNQSGTYYSRVSASEEVRHHLREMVKMVFDIGLGRWRVACSEWNLHPPHQPMFYHMTKDMAAALYVASMFGVFWDENVDSAQLFEFFGPPANDPNLRWFHLVEKTENGIVVNPTGEIVRLYGRYFRGDRLNTRLEGSSSYTWYAIGENTQDLLTQNLPEDQKWQKVKHEIPLVFAHACHDAENERMVVMLANRHMDKKAPVTIKLSNFRASRVAKCVTVTAEDPEVGAAIVQESAAKAEGSGEFKVLLPPHSVTAVLIGGGIPPTDAELFENIKWVNDWVVGDVIDPVEGGSAHGLDVSLPSSALQPKRAMKAKEGWGYVDFMDVLKGSGKAQKLSEGFKAVATSWVFSPCDREVNFSLGLNYWGRLYVYGKEALSVLERDSPPGPDSHRGTLPLTAGWNRICVRIASGSEGMGFWLGIEDRKDLQFMASPERPAWPKQWGVSAKDGTYVIDLEDGKNFSQEDVLMISPGPFRRAFVRWPMEKPDQGISLDDLSFRLVLAKAYSWNFSWGAGVVHLRPVIEEWDNDKITFNQQPKLGDRLPATASLKEGQWIFEGPDIDDLVKGWLRDTSKNFGIAVECEGEPGSFGAFFNVSNTEKGPYLEINAGQDSPQKR